MTGVKRLLVPLDGSPLSESILPVAAAWAQAEGAEILLLRAAHPDRPAPRDAAGMPSEHAEEAYLAGIASQLAQCGRSSVRTAVSYDRPERAIIETAWREQADLIAMATHARSGIRRALLGSVAESVIRSAGVPVLLIRGQATWEPGAASRILVALDGSKRAEGIIPIAERLASSHDLGVILLQVIEPPGLDERSIPRDALIMFRRDYAERYLAKIAESMGDRGLRAHPVVRLGRAANTIAAVAVEEGVNLIAMSTRGRRGLNRIVLGSVAAQVLRKTSMPLLLATDPPN